MKKLIVVLTLLIVAGMLVACDSGTNSNQGRPNQEFRGYLTLQGKIMDALTGAGVGGSDLQVFLIQGLSNRYPDKLTTDVNNVLVGEYAFANIPVYALSTGPTNEVRYKVVVVKGGYQRFEGEMTFTVDAVVATGVSDTFNTTFNWIGNIYIFPTTASSGDVDVYVYSPQNIPVPGATVQLVQNINANVIHSDTTAAGNRIFATNGLVSDLSATTDTAGKATFASSTLTLGGNYDIQVLPITFQGQELAFYNANPNADGIQERDFTVGTASSTQVVTLVNLDNSLYALSASNENPSTITSTGVLTVTFNQAVKLSTMTFNAAISSGGLSAATYTGALDTTNTILTLTPTITTAPTAAGATLGWTYGGTISLVNSQAATTYTLFTGTGTDVMNIKTGGRVSGTVHLLAD